MRRLIETCDRTSVHGSLRFMNPFMNTYMCGHMCVHVMVDLRSPGWIPIHDDF
jgi:hypothetical protein